MHLLANVVRFQVGWFACVVGAANGAPLLGTMTVAAIVLLHLSLSSKPLRELALLLAAGLLGAIWDSVLVYAGWLAYPSGSVVTGFAPHWIVAMWILFATTLNVSLRWLRGRVVLAAIIGGIAGPLAYYAGAELGGVIFVDPRAGYLALALGWAVLLPLLGTIATRLDGMAVIHTGRAYV
ncbi:MAG TPA: DUF2878 domain-containing protein [Gammaproteobacteria bacterium]